MLSDARDVVLVLQKSLNTVMLAMSCERDRACLSGALVFADAQLSSYERVVKRKEEEEARCLVKGVRVLRQQAVSVLGAMDRGSSLNTGHDEGVRKALAQALVDWNRIVDTCKQWEEEGGPESELARDGASTAMPREPLRREPMAREPASQ